MEWEQGGVFLLLRFFNLFDEFIEVYSVETSGGHYEEVFEVPFDALEGV